MGKNYMKLEFLSSNTSKYLAVEAINSFIKQLNLSIQEESGIIIAVDEAVENCKIHAYPEKPGPIMIKCQILKNDIVDIIIKDKGVGIEDCEKAKTSLFTTRKDDEHSGMGFTIIKTNMDEFEITSKLGVGTTIHMKKKICKLKNDRYI